MHADRTNRVVAVLIAIAMVTAGAIGLAVSRGAFGPVTQHGALTANRVGAFVDRNTAWFWPVVALVAVLVVVLALRWLKALLFSTDRVGSLSIPAGSRPGRTTLTPRALTDAVAQEIQGYRGVDAARARLVGDPHAPRLVVAASLQETADLAALRHRIETGAVAHARTAVGNPTLPTRLDLTVTTKRASRVA